MGGNLEEMTRPRGHFTIQTSVQSTYNETNKRDERPPPNLGT